MRIARTTTRLLVLAGLTLVSWAATAAVPTPAHRLAGSQAARNAARTVLALERATLHTPPAPGRTAYVARELEQVEEAGHPALLDLVGRLTAETRMDRASERARVALVAGALHALGKTPDDAAVTLGKTVLGSAERSPIILGAAAAVLGRRAAAEDVSALIALAGGGDGARRNAALAGLGHARVAASLHYLAARLRTADAALTQAAEAAAFAGSSWAWEALGPTRAQEGAALRAELVDALIDAWPRANGDARMAIARALLVVDVERAVASLDALRATRPELPTDEALAALQRRLRDSLGRR